MPEPEGSFDEMVAAMVGSYLEDKPRLLERVKDLKADLAQEEQAHANTKVAVEHLQADLWKEKKSHATLTELLNEAQREVDRVRALLKDSDRRNGLLRRDNENLKGGGKGVFRGALSGLI
jgi:septal ring factor EnvC (AmiA/AmiB activator)